jgi:hypothetical protein
LTTAQRAEPTIEGESMRVPWWGWVVLGVALFALLLWHSAYVEERALVRRFIEGVDTGPQPMSDDEMSKLLIDPWGALVLRKRLYPDSLDGALRALDELPEESRHGKQDSYFVSESGNLPINLTLAREFRMVVSRASADDSSIILVSAPAGDRQGFIELMSWDPNKRAFNFYRRTQAQGWVWKGDGTHARQAQTREKSCFACHVYGVPIMKELRAPWGNWHSQSATIPPEAIPSEEIRDGPLFANKSGAEKLERLVRRWMFDGVKAHADRWGEGGESFEASLWLRPLFETVAVNLITSDRRGAGLDPTLGLPIAFFLNAVVLGDVLGVDVPSLDTKIRRDHYSAALKKLEVRLEDGRGFSRPGDTHFAFLIPEPGVDDSEVIRQLLRREVISRHFATCVLGVDFANPVYSPARAALLKYVPQSVPWPPGDLSAQVAGAIVEASKTLPASSPEGQFAANWRMAPEALRADLRQRIQKYFESVQARLKMPADVEAYCTLAASRRWRFSESPLNEFPLLLPRTNVPKTPVFRMNPDGSVVP